MKKINRDHFVNGKWGENVMTLRKEGGELYWTAWVEEYMDSPDDGKEPLRIVYPSKEVRMVPEYVQAGDLYSAVTESDDYAVALYFDYEDEKSRGRSTTIYEAIINSNHIYAVSPQEAATLLPLLPDGNYVLVLCMGRELTKESLRYALEKGITLKELGFADDVYYKTSWFKPGKIIYIPDMEVNGIPCDKDLSQEEVDHVISCCYTSEDFYSLCNGNVLLAVDIFDMCEWQHPVTALNDLRMATSDEEFVVAYGISWDKLFPEQRTKKIMAKDIQADVVMCRSNFNAMYHLCFVNGDGQDDETEYTCAGTQSIAENVKELNEFWSDFCKENGLDTGCLTSVVYVGRDLEVQ